MINCPACDKWSAQKFPNKIIPGMTVDFKCKNCDAKFSIQVDFYAEEP